MGTPTLIYCGGGNQKFAQIAQETGWKLGACCRDTVYLPIYFSDQDWEKPNKQKYIEFIREHQPYIATVLDFERREQLPSILAQAEEIALHVEKLIIIPKFVNSVELIPNKINNREVILGYSVPTKYGRTITPLWEFGWRKVHLLGGSPQKQYELSHYLNVVSVDGNMMMKMAIQYCAFWRADKSKSKYGYWPQLKEIGLVHLENAPYKAFELSCINIKEFWRKI